VRLAKKQVLQESVEIEGKRFHGRVFRLGPFACPL
jgi:hypothetical protein